MKDDNDYDEEVFYPDDMEHLAKALCRAKQEFENYFQEQGMDGIWWEIEMTGYTMSGVDFPDRKKDKLVMTFNVEEDDDDEEDIEDKIRRSYDGIR